MSRKPHPGPDRRKPVLIVQHARHEHPAAMRRALESQGIQSHWIHPYQGEKYPDLSSIRGIISLGGPMGANDEAHHPWILEELKLLRAAVESHLPVAGICLGGQLMARAMGGRVEKNPVSEVGWFPIQVNLEGQQDRILAGAGPEPMVYQWHLDTFHPPRQAVILAHSEHCERQAYRIGDSAYGFQFHPEADHQLLDEWLACDGIEHDIECARLPHSPHTVQDLATQKAHSKLGERASLRITAAIGQLFRTHAYGKVTVTSYEQLEAWAVHRTQILVEFEGSDRRAIRLRGQISSILKIPDGEFLIFKEDSSVLWPIRLDDLKMIVPI